MFRKQRQIHFDISLVEESSDKKYSLRLSYVFVVLIEANNTDSPSAGETDKNWKEI